MTAHAPAPAPDAPEGEVPVAPTTTAAAAPAAAASPPVMAGLVPVAAPPSARSVTVVGAPAAAVPSPARTADVEAAQARLHARARGRGVNPVVYWIVRALLQPAFLVYFRLQRIGRAHVPESGPVIIAANHRSFLDPFVIGMMTRRPVFYVAKRELFANRLVGWLLSSLGAFPVHRGTGDQDMLATARAILSRGGVVLIFPEGTRTRPGPLGRPRRGFGRLALETGAAVVPVAIAGTEDVRRGWRIRPRKVRVAAGRARRFKPTENPSPQLAAALTERVWPDVEAQYAALQARARRTHGLPAVRKRRPTAA